MKAIWKDIDVTLLQALQLDAGEKVSELTFKMITRAQHKAVLDEYEGDRDAIYRELVKLGAGLSDGEVARLVTPDYNTLQQCVDEVCGEASDFWFKKLQWTAMKPAERKSSEAAYRAHSRLPLLVPVDTVTAGMIDAIDLKFPTIGALDKMNQLPEEQQDAFITMHITGLGADELGSLSVPDGKALNLRVSDFLSKTGSFFSAGTTSKPSLT